MSDSDMIFDVVASEQCDSLILLLSGPYNCKPSDLALLLTEK
jgi:hypothetical protein